MSISIHESSTLGFSKVIETRLLYSFYARKKGSKVYTFPSIFVQNAFTELIKKHTFCDA